MMNHARGPHVKCCLDTHCYSRCATGLPHHSRVTCYSLCNRPSTPQSGHMLQPATVGSHATACATGLPHHSRVTCYSLPATPQSGHMLQPVQLACHTMSVAPKQCFC